MQLPNKKFIDVFRQDRRTAMRKESCDITFSFAVDVSKLCKVFSAKPARITTRSFSREADVCRYDLYGASQCRRILSPSKQEILFISVKTRRKGSDLSNLDTGLMCIPGNMTCFLSAQRMIRVIHVETNGQKD